MTLEDRAAALFQMDDDTWHRHASPWSVWTRNTVLPALILAVWSRVWLGWWALLPVGAALLWTWLNPRLFSPPDSLDNWASKAVLGERVWMNRDKVPVPPHHRRTPNVLNVVSLTGSLFVVGGVVQLTVWPTLFGAALVYAGKLWFLDRMVWLYEDMKGATPAYRAMGTRPEADGAS
jgi:hypothetical protein